MVATCNQKLLIILKLFKGHESSHQGEQSFKGLLCATQQVEQNILGK